MSEQIIYVGRNEQEQALINTISQTNPQVFTFWNELSDEQKNSLIADLTSIDMTQIMSYYHKFQQTQAEEQIQFGSTEFFSYKNVANENQIRQSGKKALANGEVAFLTVAGGQASRLDYEYPKGCFPISPITKKPLFQIFAEKIRYYSAYYGREMDWYIMTSETNYDDTLSFFDKHNYWGLNPSHVTFFKQGMLPALTPEGKLILSEKNRIFRNPDGHGGILTALVKTGLINKIRDNGIKYLSYFQVDNPMINMADPSFIGYHILHGMSISTKVVEKLYPEEKMGVIGKKNGINCIIEYSDLPKELESMRLPNGHLKFGMGSMGVHIFSTDFIIGFTAKLAVHCAKKQVPGLILEDKVPTKTQIEAVKFETFVFDMIALADKDKSGFYETLRANEFYPLKNKTGTDSIDTCTKGQINTYIRWLIEAGIVKDTEAHQINKAEIGPLFAPDREIFLRLAAEEKEYIRQCVYTDGKLNKEINISEKNTSVVDIGNKSYSSFGVTNG